MSQTISRIVESLSQCLYYCGSIPHEYHNLTDEQKSALKEIVISVKRLLNESIGRELSRTELGSVSQELKYLLLKLDSIVSELIKKGHEIDERKRQMRPVHEAIDVLELYDIGSLDANILKRHWRIVARKWHPDRNPMPEAYEKIKQINKAYNFLRHMIEDNSGVVHLNKLYDAEGLKQE